MGAYDALRNLMIMLFIINIGATLTAAIFPDFAYAMNGEQFEQLASNMMEQVNTLQPSETGTLGDYVTAFGLIVTFAKNTITGNYYVWRALGLDKGFKITSTGVEIVESSITLAHVLSVICLLVYALGMAEFLRGRV